MNICVFCSAQELPENYTKPALKAIVEIAHNGHTLIWGGTDTGLMRDVASAAQEAGAQIVGVSVEFLKHKARANANEMIIANDLADRKSVMIERSDAFLVLVGGIGTLDEVTEIIERKKHGAHSKPIVFLNTDNFYKGLQNQLQRMEADGFLTSELAELVAFTDTPDEAVRLLEDRS